MANHNLRSTSVYPVIPHAFEVLVKKRAVSGVFVLGLRRIVFQLILTGGNIVLARLFFPEIIGQFTIISFIVTFFSVSTDLGLGQALVQKSSRPTLTELRTVFTVHLLLGIFSFSAAYLSAPFIAAFYHEQLGDQGAFLIRFMAVSLLFYGLRRVSSFILERELRFMRFSIGEILEIVTIQGMTIFFALSGYGLESFVFGAVIGRIVGFIAFFLLSPWSIGFSFSVKRLRRLLEFGVPMQINILIGLVNGALAPLFIGKFPGPGGYSGTEAVGLISWAGGLALASQAVSELVQRIIFPAVSRLQEEPRLLAPIIERGLLLASFLSFPMMALIAGLARPITYLIYSDKWLPGLLVLYLLLVHSAVMVLWTVLMPVFLGLGMSKYVRDINLYWSLGQWFVIVPLVSLIGFVGFAWGQLLTSVILIIPIRRLKRRIPLSLSKYILPYIIISIASGLLVNGLHRLVPVENIYQLFFYAFIGGVSYLVLVFAFRRREVFENVLKVKTFTFEKG